MLRVSCKFFTRYQTEIVLDWFCDGRPPLSHHIQQARPWRGLDTFCDRRKRFATKHAWNYCNNTGQRVKSTCFRLLVLFLTPKMNLLKFYFRFKWTCVTLRLGKIWNLKLYAKTIWYQLTSLRNCYWSTMKFVKEIVRPFVIILYLVSAWLDFRPHFLKRGARAPLNGNRLNTNLLLTFAKTQNNSAHTYIAI